jgi:hypothetical protein
MQASNAELLVQPCGVLLFDSYFCCSAVGLLLLQNFTKDVTMFST